MLAHIKIVHVHLLDLQIDMISLKKKVVELLLEGQEIIGSIPSWNVIKLHKILYGRPKLIIHMILNNTVCIMAYEKYCTWQDKG